MSEFDRTFCFKSGAASASEGVTTIPGVPSEIVRECMHFVDMVIQDSVSRFAELGADVEITCTLTSEPSLAASCIPVRDADGLPTSCAIDVASGALTRLWAATYGIYASRFSKPDIDASLWETVTNTVWFGGEGLALDKDLRGSAATLLYGEFANLTDLGEYAKGVIATATRTWLTRSGFPVDSLVLLAARGVAWGTLFLVVHELAHFEHAHDLLRRTASRLSPNFREFFACGIELEADYIAAARLTAQAARFAGLEPGGEAAQQMSQWDDTVADNILWEHMMQSIFVVLQVIEVERLVYVDRHATAESNARAPGVAYSFDTTRWAVVCQGAQEVARHYWGSRGQHALVEKTRIALETGVDGLFWWLADALEDRADEDGKTYSKRALVRAASLLRRWSPGNPAAESLAQLGTDSLLIFHHLVAWLRNQPESMSPIAKVIEAHRRSLEHESAPWLSPQERQAAVDAGVNDFRRLLEAMEGG